MGKANVGIAVEGATDAAQGAAAIVLTSPGLSVIVEAIDLSRKIFQRMKNYVIYRIACTLQLLVFFFLATMCVDPETVMGGKGFLDKSQAQDDLHKIPRYFALPVMAMVLITILNDGTIISIAYDYVEAGKVPEKWNLPVVCSIAALLGGVACGGSMLMLYMCLSTTDPDSFLVKYFNVENLTYRQIQCALYLKVSISDFLTVFAARTHGFSSRVVPEFSLVALQFSQRARPRSSPGCGPSMTWSLFPELLLASCGRTASFGSSSRTS